MIHLVTVSENKKVTINRILLYCVTLIDLECIIILQKCIHMIISIKTYTYFWTSINVTEQNKIHIYLKMGPGTKKSQGATT